MESTHAHVIVIVRAYMQAGVSEHEIVILSVHACMRMRLTLRVHNVLTWCAKLSGLAQETYFYYGLNAYFMVNLG